MTALDAVSSEGSESTVSQLRLSLLLFIPPDSSRFLESFNDVMHHRGLNIQIPSDPSLRNTVFKQFKNVLEHLLANWQSFAPKALGLSWMLLLYQIMITITCWHHLFGIISFFNHCSWLLALNCSVPSFLGWCCRPEWQEWMYIYKKFDQTKYKISYVYTVCNEIPVKLNLEITAVFFICIFHTVPTWVGFVLYMFQ